MCRAVVLGMLVVALGASSGCTHSSIIGTVASPHGTAKARWYRSDPGAAGTGWDSVTVMSTEGDESERELWRGPVLPSPPVWIDEKTLLVGEQRLEVDAPAFDWWDDRPADGLSTPEEAAEVYLYGLANDDITAVQIASRPIVTSATMAEQRVALLGTSDVIRIGDLRLARSNQGEDFTDFAVAISITQGDERTLRALTMDVTCVFDEGHWHVEYANEDVPRE